MVVVRDFRDRAADLVLQRPGSDRGRVPHYEYLIGPLGALLFYFIGARKYFSGRVTGALALLTREDIGLHLFGFFFVWIVYLRWFAGWNDREHSGPGSSACWAFGGSILMFVVAEDRLPRRQRGDAILLRLAGLCPRDTGIRAGAPRAR